MGSLGRGTMTEQAQAVRIAGMVGRGILILLISGLLGAALELNPRLRRESIEILRRQRAEQQSSLNFYPRFIALRRARCGRRLLFHADESRRAVDDGLGTGLPGRRDPLTGLDSPSP